MSTQFGYSMRSTDGGTNWIDIGSVSNSAWVSPYWQHPTDFNKVYAAIGRRIYRSTDRGVNWGTGFSATFTTSRVTSVAQSAVTVANMMAASSYFTTSPISINLPMKELLGPT